jgi:hypothetical protein
VSAIETKTPPHPRADPLVGAARLLAGFGLDAADRLLAEAAEAIGCEEVVLRSPDLRQVIASSGRTRLRRSEDAGWLLDAPVRACGRILGVLTARGGAPFNAAGAALLTSYADLLALALAAVPHPGGLVAAGRTVLEEEAERARLAADLYDTVGEALVAIRYAADLVVAGRADAGVLDEAVRGAHGTLRRSLRDLRAQALDDGLRAALRGLAVRSGGDRPADGRPALLITVQARDSALDAVAPPIAVTVQRIAEAVLRSTTGRVTVSATCDVHGVKLHVDSADIGCDASELDRWARRAKALGGRLDVRPDGVELRLPAQLPAREGPDDHRPDL